MDEFDWETYERTENWQQEYERKRADATYQTARVFVKHLQELIAKSDNPSSNWIQISQKELYKDFVYPQIAKDAWLTYEKRNFAETEKGAWLAYKEGLISINENVRPFKYTLLEQDPSIFELRPYQKNIIEDTTNASGSVLIEAPTGSGKSVIANEIAKREVEKGGKVLIVAPKIILLEQLKETFEELSPQIIHGAKDYNTNHSVFISTIQTAHKRDLGFEPTMILIDEVHFGFSGKMIDQLLEDFNGRLIGLSATPYDEKGEALQGFDLHINKYNLRYMLENKYLLHPKCYAPLKVDLSHISTVGVDYNQSELDDAFNNLESISQIVESTKEIIQQRKASLVFCINIAHSEAMAKAYTDAGIPTKAIHSKLTKEEQKSILNEFKSGSLKMLANPMMLTTGFDHPITDTIVMARATKSQNLYRQMVGRALRLSKGKEDAVILDCSNVISNLGLPTEDIKKRERSFSKGIRICKECESEKLYKTIKDNRAYLVCADCGNIEFAMENGYECESCGLIHTNRASFKTDDGSLYLVCDECKHETLVSEASTKEELSLIFDVTYINNLKKKVTLDYLTYLIDEKGADFIFEPMVIKHIKSLQALIVKIPQVFANLDSSHFKYNVLVLNKDATHDGYEWIRQWNKDWRIFEQNFEDEILNDGIRELKQQLENSIDTANSLQIIQNIFTITKQPLLQTSFMETIVEDIQKSKVKNMNTICNKRIKDLYFNNEDLTQMTGFIQLMESVL
jgi:superfamily II DNA or RNA helicase